MPDAIFPHPCRAPPRLLQGLAWRGVGWVRGGPLRLARINGALGAVVQAPDGAQTIAFEATGEGLIGAIYVVRNPEKAKPAIGFRGAPRLGGANCG
ncbi:MAG: hypothetical protein P4L73_01100 [Caulobacteraceae bacterium]|nr:hypothetical protein [Caulobacteraceae bacterium]